MEPISSPMISPLDRLRLFLRPEGSAVVTGYTLSELSKATNHAFEDTLQKIRRVDTVLLGAPLDTRAIPSGKSSQGTRWFRDAARTTGFSANALDIGDVLTVPHLVHDSMLAPDSHRELARVLYPDVLQSLLPVSPLSLLDAVLSAVRELNSGCRIVVLGGDHAITPIGVKAALQYRRKDEKGEAGRLGVIQIGGTTGATPSALALHTAAGWREETLELVPAPHWARLVRDDSAACSESVCLGSGGSWSDDVDRGIQQFEALGVQSLYFTMELGEADGETLSLDDALVSSTVSRFASRFRVAGADLVAGPRLGSPALKHQSEKIFLRAADYLEGTVSQKSP